MRIGLIIYGSIDTITGGYIYDKKLITHLINKGCEVKIFSQRNTNLLENLQNNLSTEMIDSIRAFSPDILLEDEMNYASLVLMNTHIKKTFQIPIICIVHLLNGNAQPFISRMLHKKLEYLYLKTVSGFIFNSNSTKRLVSDFIGKVPAELVAYPGKDRISVEINKQIILQKNTNRKIHILFLGNLLHNKGLHLLIQALAKINKKNWQLSIAGNAALDMEYSSRIFEMIEMLGLKYNVRMLGLLNQHEIADEFMQHHILAVPSYFESYGISYAEAMGAGLPIIATCSGGSSEIVKHAVNGFLITPGDIEMLRSALLNLIKNRELLINMSLASLALYQDLPSWDDSMEKIYCFLKQIISALATKQPKT